MTRNNVDPFKALEIEPSFYIDSDLIEDAFRRAASLAHPDQTTGSVKQFQELQEAISIIRDPVKRLRYFADAEEPKSSPLPSIAMELFSRVISSLQKCDTLVAKYQRAISTLAKMLLKTELLEIQQEIQHLFMRVEEWELSLQKELQHYDTIPATPSSKQLLELANQFNIAQRWLGELRERNLLLTTVL